MKKIRTSSPPEADFPSWVILPPLLRTYGGAALLLIIALTLFRWIYAPTLELVGDEAYYWLWSKHLDWSYFSKGPGVAWTIWLGTTIWGDTVFGVRFFSVLLSAGTGIGVFLLGRMLFDSRTGFWAAVTAACLPLFGIGSVLMTIDPISVFFWTAAALTFWQAQNQPQRAGLWTITGLLVGLGMLAKYTNAVQLLCFLAYLACVPNKRKILLSPKFWFLPGVALLCLLPVAIWNHQHDWITVQHLVYRSGASESFTIRPGELLEFWLMQAVVISPLIWLGIIAATFVALTQHRRDPRHIYLLSLFLPLVIMYSILSLNKTGEANWTAPSYIGGVVLAAAIWLPLCDKILAWRITARAAIGFGAIATIILHNTYLLPFELRKDPLDRVRGSEDLAMQVRRLQQENGVSFFIADNYGRASLLAFYLPGQPFVHLPRSEGVHNQFSFWSDYADGYLGLNALFITRGGQDKPPSILTSEFESVELLTEGVERHRGRNIRPFTVFLCRNYIGVPKEE